MSGIVVSWSSGKDSAWTLHLLRRRGVEVSALLTTVTREFDRVSVHGVRRSVLRRQAAAVGVPLVEVELPWPCSNDMYEFAWAEAVRELRDRTGVAAVAFGDLFLADVRAYRERILGELGVEASFPLWGMRTDLLGELMLRASMEARIVCLDPKRLDRRWAGAAWDADFLAALPEGVDPCGENGEFHTVVTAGPMFAEALALAPGEVVEREGLVYADFKPADRLTEPDPAATAAPVEGGASQIESPCRNVCRVGADGLCDGCGRTLAEIGNWLGMSGATRRAVIARVIDWRVRDVTGPTFPRRT